jgi:hypothetical protein
MGTINSSDRIAATLYSLGTWLVSGICPCINTLHKGDSDDDDDDDDNTNNNNNNLDANLRFWCSYCDPLFRDIV